MVYCLVNNTSLGGTERRMGRLFSTLVAQDPDAQFLVNAGLWRRLVEGGVLNGAEPRIIPLGEPFSRIAGVFAGLNARLAFWIRKVDYALIAIRVLLRFVWTSPRTFHVVLGGLYVLLPLKLVRPAHRIVASVTNPNLSKHVGTPWAVPLYRWALARCERVDALTNQVRDDLVRRGVDPRRIRVSSGSVVNADRFRPAAHKEPWVVFAGRLVEEKNPLLFVEAAAEVARAMPSARFVILGEGELAGAVRDAIARLGLERVVSMRFEADTAATLATGMVFVSLQRQDNYPSQSLMEAMACGMAVVATDVGLTWKLVDESTGVRVKAEAGEVAKAILAMRADPEKVRRLGAAGRQRVILHHSETDYRAYVAQLYAA